MTANVFVLRVWKGISNGMLLEIPLGSSVEGPIGNLSNICMESYLCFQKTKTIVPCQMEILIRFLFKLQFNISYGNDLTVEIFYFVEYQFTLFKTCKCNVQTSMLTVLLFCR